MADKPIFRFLSDEQRQIIANAALKLLEEVGFRLTEPEARELLQGAGASIAGDRVRLPRQLVEEAIRSTPRQLTIYKRDGQPAMQIGENSVHYGAHTDAPDVLDPFTGERRPCREQDVRRHAALIDALTNLDYTTASGLVADWPAQLGDRVSLACCLQHSSKPVLAMPVTLETLMDCHRMAALAVGSREMLRARPILIVYAEPVSPLLHPDESIRKLLYCAEHAIPLVYSAYAAMGGTAPMGQAAIIAQLCAESLSGLVVHQLKRRGSPFIFGGMASVMDMRTTVFSYGAPEFQRGNALMAEMAHHFGLPNFGTAGTSDAQLFDGQAVAEVMSSCLMAHLSAANLIHDVGLLGSATLIVPEMIVAADELIAMLRHLLDGAPVSEETLALDILAEVGPGGEFVTHPHTLRHFRQVWYPTLFYRGGARAWIGGEQIDFERRVKVRTQQLIDSHRPEPLPEGVVEALWEVIVEAGQRVEKGDT